MNDTTIGYMIWLVGIATMYEIRFSWGVILFVSLLMISFGFSLAGEIAEVINVANRAKEEEQ